MLIISARHCVRAPLRKASASRLTWSFLMSPGIFHGSYSLVEIGYRLWRYIPDPNEPLTYTTADGRAIRIDAEFETDGATVPRFLWSIPGLDPMDWPRAAILHDWLWELHI